MSDEYKCEVCEDTGFWRWYRGKKAAQAGKVDN